MHMEVFFSIILNLISYNTQTHIRKYKISVQVQNLIPREGQRSKGIIIFHNCLPYDRIMYTVVSDELMACLHQVSAQESESKQSMK